MIDISVPLHDGMLQYPGDPAYRRDWWYRMDEGKNCNVSLLHLCAHTGTHMDAPFHFLQDGVTLDALPPERFMGVCRVVDLRGRPVIDAADVDAVDPQPGERLLFKTDNADSMRRDDFNPDYVALTPAAARRLAERGVAAVGIDYLSVEPYGQDGQTHRALLEGGIVVYEGYDVSSVPAGMYNLIALPILVQDSDGAPCRMLLQEIDK